MFYSTIKLISVVFVLCSTVVLVSCGGGGGGGTTTPTNQGFPAGIDITRISVSSAGDQSNGSSLANDISWDGRYIVFVSDGTNLVTGDTNGQADIFIHDRSTNQTSRVSFAHDGGEPNAGSNNPTTSENAAHVAFMSSASNIIDNDTNSRTDVFLRDLVSGTNEAISVSTGGALGNENSDLPSVSDDGRYVVFESEATNLVAGDTNGTYDIFLRDRQTNTTTRISTDSTGQQADGASRCPAISGNGRYCVFHSAATNLVAGDTNTATDIFMKDLQTGATTIISLDNAGGPSDGDSEYPSINTDGQFVVFESVATDIVAGDTNGQRDVFRRDTTANITVRASEKDDGTQGNGTSYNAYVSGDGRYVIFVSWASSFDASDNNSVNDVFSYDHVTGIVQIESVSAGGTVASDRSFSPSISRNGNYISFRSAGNNLVTNDTNGEGDVFCAPRGN